MQDEVNEKVVSLAIKTSKLTAEVLQKAMKALLAKGKGQLTKEKRETVLLYYFFDMSEREIAKFCNLSRTTVQSRRTSSMKLLKRYLEEKAYDCTD